ncbi:MAG: hypothetical protein CM15mP81_05840 [Alphaproteobacteria bacterium]|nr:MAG: hypothetical protein CM15mP81_05840 [Alphaproteobacteria bacterium]
MFFLYQEIKIINFRKGVKVSYTVNKMPDQIDESLLKKCLKAETATIGHKRHLGFVNRQVQNILNEKRRLQAQQLL